MQSWLSNLKSAMMSSRLGARVVRWNGWIRLNPFALSLMFAFALVVCPATRAFAASGSLGTVTIGNYTINDENFWIVDYTDRYSYYDAVSGRTYSIAHTTDATNGNVYYYQLNTTAKDFNRYSINPHVKVHTTFSIQIPFSYSQVPSLQGAKYRQGEFSLKPTIAATYAPTGFTIVSELYSVENVSVTGQYKTDFNYQSYDTADGGSQNLRIDFSYPLRERTGNNTDYIIVTIKCEAIFRMSGQQTSLNALISNTAPFTIISINTNSPAWRDVEIADYTPYAHQNADNIDAIAQAIGNNDTAANALNQANQNFVQDAAQLESHQAVLEGAADASIGAVDMNQINLIDTYSASVSFWSQLIGQLPTVLGSLWYVFIFGLLLAFVLFVLRIRR